MCLNTLMKEIKSWLLKWNIIHFSSLYVRSSRGKDLGWLHSNSLLLIGKGLGDRPEERIDPFSIFYVASLYQIVWLVLLTFFKVLYDRIITIKTLSGIFCTLNPSTLERAGT